EERREGHSPGGHGSGVVPTPLDETRAAGTPVAPGAGSGRMSADGASGMKTAYFDCFAGVAGDMIVGALLDAGARVPAVREGIASLGLRGVRVEARRAIVGGFRATRFEVLRPAREEHRGLPDVERILASAPLPERVRERARAIFRRLAAAEAAVHGTTA